MAGPTRQRGKRKRTRTSTEEVADSAPRNSVEAHPSTSPRMTSITITDTLEAAVIRYKEWQRRGAPHDEKCFRCEGQDNLHDCYTCRRSFHEHCLSKPAAHYFHHENFFCGLCIEREWHEKAPPLSPPPSPPPQRSRVALPTHRTNMPQVVEALQSPSPSTVGNQDSSSTLSTTSLAWLPHNLSTHPAISPAPNSQRDSYLSAATPALDASRGAAGTRGARSRFSTLSSEVDNAVSLLLRELEYLGDAREQIRRLEGLVVKLQQDIRITENALILAQRNAAAQSHRHQENLSGENEKLKKEVERLNKLLGEEKSKSESHKAEASDWKGQVQNKQTELDELRGKLKGLLGA